MASADQISTDQIKELRDRTGISVVQCKKALEETGGNIEKAIMILQKNSKSVASKKSQRELKAGTIASYIHTTGAVAAMVELSSETDFVAKNEEFKMLAYEIAMHITAAAPEYLKRSDVKPETLKMAEEMFAKDVEGKSENLKAQIMEGKLASYFKDRVLLEQPFIKNQDMSIKELIDGAIQKFGEKIAIRRFTRYSVL